MTFIFLSISKEVLQLNNNILVNTFRNFMYLWDTLVHDFMIQLITLLREKIINSVQQDVNTLLKRKEQNRLRG